MKYLVLLVFILSACAGTQSITQAKIFAEPEYTLSAIRFIEIDMKHLALEVDLTVSNPNYLGLEFQNVSYQLTLDSKQVLNGELKDKLTVPAKGDVDVTIPLTVDMGQLANGALSLMMNRKIAYQFEAKLNSTIPILDKKTFTVVKSEVLSF
jgi:LEA14-like dessication related protein